MIPKFRLHYQKYYTRFLKVIPGGNLLILEPESEIKPVHGGFQHLTSVNSKKSSSIRIVHNGNIILQIRNFDVPGKNKGIILTI